MRNQTTGSVQQVHLFVMIHGVSDLYQHLGHGHGSELGNSLRKVGTDVHAAESAYPRSFCLSQRS